MVPDFWCTSRATMTGATTTDWRPSGCSPNDHRSEVKHEAGGSPAGRIGREGNVARLLSRSTSWSVSRVRSVSRLWSLSRPWSISRLLRWVKHELKVYRLLLSDARTPMVARVLIAVAVFYTVSPVDLIPDFIPIIGFIDDVIIVPGLLVIALKLIPKELVADCRMRASAA